MQRNYFRALSWFHRAAAKNHAAANWRIGVFYEEGLGVEQNYTKATEWYQRAAGQGFPEGQFALAVCYGEGLGVPQDHAIAFELYSKAAEQNHPGAQNNLAALAIEGEDYATAAKWFEAAARQGDAVACYNLSCCYKEGLGVEKDYGKALEWCRKATKKDFTDWRLIE